MRRALACEPLRFTFYTLRFTDLEGGRGLANSLIAPSQWLSPDQRLPDRSGRRRLSRGGCVGAVGVPLSAVNFALL